MVKHGCWAAGMVSASVLEAPVVGPAHHHVRLTDHGSFFGRLTSEANPVSYLLALQQVFTDFCRDAGPVTLPDGSSAPMPLVVNTPGWVKVSTGKSCITGELLTLAQCWAPAQNPRRDGLKFRIPHLALEAHCTMSSSRIKVVACTSVCSHKCA